MTNERIELKIICEKCKGLGSWWIGDGSGNTSSCSYCNGKGSKKVYGIAFNDHVEVKIDE